MSETIFTKIIKGEIPCHKVYEDDKTFAFMDIHPIQPGHVLLVSKNPAVTVWELPDADYAAMMESAKKIAHKLREVFKEKKRIGMMIEGLEVDHAHIKLFPIDSGDEFRHAPDVEAEPDHAALSALAKKLAIQENN